MPWGIKWSGQCPVGCGAATGLLELEEKDRKRRQTQWKESIRTRDAKKTDMLHPDHKSPSRKMQTFLFQVGQSLNQFYLK